MKRRQWDSKTKAQIVLEGLSGKPVSEVCNQYQISQNQYYQWRDEPPMACRNIFSHDSRPNLQTIDSLKSTVNADRESTAKSGYFAKSRTMNDSAAATKRYGAVLRNMNLRNGFDSIHKLVVPMARLDGISLICLGAVAEYP